MLRVFLFEQDAENLMRTMPTKKVICFFRFFVWVTELRGELFYHVLRGKRRFAFFRRKVNLVDACEKILFAILDIRRELFFPFS